MFFRDFFRDFCQNLSIMPPSTKPAIDGKMTGFVV